MLRIITRKRGRGYVLELHGVLGHEWVALLEQSWRATTAGGPAAKITVVLSDVAFIDAEGERLLGRMAEAGVAFVVSGCLNRHVVENLQPRARVRRQRNEIRRRKGEV
jgi:anti-anti-sigma regulatory factor